MTKTTTNLLGILITILAGSYFFMMYCSECRAAEKTKDPPMEEKVTPESVPRATAFPFTISDDVFEYSVNDNFNFRPSSSAILTPVAQKVQSGVDSLKFYLEQSPGKVLNIKGFYMDDESNTTAFPNLGMARANAAKNYFISKGITSKSLNIDGVLKNDLVPENDIIKGPLAFTVRNASAESQAELGGIYKAIQESPLVLQFETAETTIDLSPEQRQKVADIVKYLDKVDGASCTVVGHTDNTGQRTTNIRLGQERADFARAYLVKNGIPEAKILASSNGPDTPVATNTTEEGRSQNRRTVVTLIQN